MIVRHKIITMENITESSSESSIINFTIKYSINILNNDLKNKNVSFITGPWQYVWISIKHKCQFLIKFENSVVTPLFQKGIIEIYAIFTNICYLYTHSRFEIIRTCE